MFNLPVTMENAGCRAAALRVLKKRASVWPHADMEYVEHPVPEELHRHLQCLWELRDESPRSDIQVVYPDGRCELVAELGVPMSFHRYDGEVRENHSLIFAAQQRGPIRLQACGRVHCVGVRLTAAASSLIAGARLPDLRDQAPDLHTVDAGFANAFGTAVRAYVDSQSPDPLWELMRRRCAALVPDPAVEAAAALLDEHQGDLRVSELAGHVGLGLRRLQQRFLAQIGATCKEYARIRRLQGLLSTLDTRRLALAEAAMQHGYADQAHATRDLGHFTGTTPAKLVHALHSDREGESTLRLAAAFVRGHAGTKRSQTKTAA